MTGFTSLRIRLAGAVLIAIIPAWVVMYWLHQPMFGFISGLVALAAAWYGGERFILRQVRALSRAAQRLATGDLRARTGMAHERGEFGELAQTFDTMAEALERRANASGENEKALVHRSLQQTVVGALGQFALVNTDLDPLLQQAVILAAQTLELEYSYVFEFKDDPGLAVLRACVGWREELQGKASVETGVGSQMRFVVDAAEPVAFEDLDSE